MIRTRLHGIVLAVVIVAASSTTAECEPPQACVVSGSDVISGAKLPKPKGVQGAGQGHEGRGQGLVEGQEVR